MYAQVEKPKENKSRAIANSVGQKKSGVKQGLGIVDNRETSKKLSKDITQRKRYSAGNRAAPLQMIKVRLADEDMTLMNELKEVSLPNSGTGHIAKEHVDKMTQPIENNENIIFEGHGNSQNGETIMQGGLTPKQLAQLAHRIPKSEGWSGSIILAGCKTGLLTENVSKEYYNLTSQAVDVKGTNANIQVGEDFNNRKFIGYNYDYPAVTGTMADDQFTKVIVDAYSKIEKISKSTTLINDLVLWITKGGNNPINVTELQGVVNDLKLAPQVNEVVANKNYKQAEREDVANTFNDFLVKINNYEQTKVPKDGMEVLEKLEDFQKKFLEKPLLVSLNRLRIKEINIDDNGQMTSNKMYKSKKGFMGIGVEWGKM